MLIYYQVFHITDKTVSYSLKITFTSGIFCTFGLFNISLLNYLQIYYNL